MDPMDRPSRMRDRATAALAGMGAAFFLLLPSLSPHYGFYSDELYYLVCAERLAFGYVDHPPFFPLVLRLHRELFGDSLLALRMLPAAAGALTAFLTGWMARRMGGGLFAQVLAALALMVSGTSLIWFSWFSVNCLEVLFWTAAAWILLERCRSNAPRLWVVLGVLLGISFLTKHTTLVLVAGLAAATMLSSLRRDWRSRWPWVGALAAVLIVSPNLYWQVVNDWPSLEFYRRLAEDNIPTSPLAQIGRQIFAQNPATLPIWASGIFFFLRSPRGRRFRPLGWLFLTVLVLAMIGGQSRADRIAGAYPGVFAGGAVLLEATRKADPGRLRRLWNTYTLPSVMLLAGCVAATLALPILPPALLTNHPLHQGEDWRPQVGPKRLPYHLGNRTHWRALVEEVAGVYGALDAKQREGAIILADYFGHAGAIEYYGAEHALPPVYSPHANYLLWGPPDGAPDPVIAIGIDEALLRASFERVTVAATFRCAYCPPWQDRLPIRVASSAKRPISELWPELGWIGGMDRRRRLLRAQESE
jgi:4-amino-4-deoxy-L-arabinose transferase-like glycosyltransferase